MSFPKYTTTTYLDTLSPQLNNIIDGFIFLNKHHLKRKSGMDCHKIKIKPVLENILAIVERCPAMFCLNGNQMLMRLDYFHMYHRDELDDNIKNKEWYWDRPHSTYHSCRNRAIYGNVLPSDTQLYEEMEDTWWLKTSYVLHSDHSYNKRVWFHKVYIGHTKNAKTPNFNWDYAEQKMNEIDAN